MIATMLSPFVDQKISVILARLRGDDLEYLAGLLSDGSLTSRIDTRYPLADTAEAYDTEGAAAQLNSFSIGLFKVFKSRVTI